MRVAVVAVAVAVAAGNANSGCYFLGERTKRRMK